jgi:hypothetical protein
MSTRNKLPVRTGLKSCCAANLQPDAQDGIPVQKVPKSDGYVHSVPSVITFEIGLLLKI